MDCFSFCLTDSQSQPEKVTCSCNASVYYWHHCGFSVNCYIVHNNYKRGIMKSFSSEAEACELLSACDCDSSALVLGTIQLQCTYPEESVK